MHLSKRIYREVRKHSSCGQAIFGNTLLATSMTAQFVEWFRPRVEWSQSLGSRSSFLLQNGFCQLLNLRSDYRLFPKLCPKWSGSGCDPDPLQVLTITIFLRCVQKNCDYCIAEQHSSIRWQSFPTQNERRMLRREEAVIYNISSCRQIQVKRKQVDKHREY